MDQKIIDSHFHIFDLNVRDSYPNQNESHGFPPPGVIGRLYVAGVNLNLINISEAQKPQHRGDREDHGGEQEPSGGRCICPVLQRLP